MVQTAYANGAAMDFAKALPGCQVVLTATGVKHLHKAAEAFDTGIYFEANGHGTVLFSQRLLQALRQELEASQMQQPCGFRAQRLLSVQGLVCQAALAW